jgi:hypothetical protein
LTYGLNLAWYPTELLTVTLTGSQDYYDSIITRNAINSSNLQNFSLAALGGTPVITDIKTVQAQADYSVTDRIVLSGVVSYAASDYPTTAREDDLLTAGASLLYIMGSNLVASAQYRYTTRTSTTPGFGFDRDQFGVALKLQY